MATPILTTGAPSPSAPQLRCELRDLQRNYPNQWNILLLGLRSFQQVDEDNDLSYYQIAGIHGRP